MKIDSQLPIYLPFYTNIERQAWRRGYAMEDDRCTVKRICNKWRVVPFQIRRETNPLTWSDITIDLYCPDDTKILELLPLMNASDRVINTYGQFDYITYFGNFDLSQPMNCGTFYIRVSDGVNVWYSELITVEDFDLETRLIEELVDFTSFY